MPWGVGLLGVGLPSINTNDPCLMAGRTAFEDEMKTVGCFRGSNIQTVDSSLDTSQDVLIGQSISIQ